MWHDFWTGEAFEGVTEVKVPASMEQIPVYVRAGSIVPWAEVGLFAGAPETRLLTARVYGDGSLPFTMRTGDTSLRLSWNNELGSAEGASTNGGYRMIAWKKIG